MNIAFSADDLRPLIREIVAEVLAANGANGSGMMTEPEAAAWCKVASHTLRDARRRGVLRFHKCGRFVRYDQSQLLAWMNTHSEREVPAE